jgi:UDP-N-acetylmuramoyl-tripeptide--D-alanyl-D-alanine ligase
MIPISLSELASITGGRLQGADLTIDNVVTDSSKVVAGSLFIALQGARFDGHEFAASAQQANAAALLVSRKLDVTLPQVVVADTRIALGLLGRWVRKQSPAKVAGLTGSSGKTSVKEMTAAILKQCGPTLYTSGNLNNDFGVPMTLLRMTTEHQYAVIEMGANHQGEIAYTTALTSPDVALVNNLSAAHLEGFGSIAGVAKAKGEIFQGLAAGGTAIINAASNDLPNWQTELQGKTLRVFSVDEKDHADYYPRAVTLSSSGSQFTLHTPCGAIEITLPLLGRHNIANALAASALAQALGAPLSAIKTGLATLQPVNGRLFPIHLAPGILLLDDTYNANAGSMQAAIEVLAAMPNQKILVVGDMAELGEQSAHYHREVGLMVSAAKIDHLLSFGKQSQLIAQHSGIGQHFDSKHSLLKYLLATIKNHQNVTILVKGSRSSAMDEVVNQLQETFTC